jgi:GDP-4-dehydro-6-deoxy-D-mannose reductase
MAATWITGADGFAGGWLRGHLEARNRPWAAFVGPNSGRPLPKSAATTYLDLAEAAKLLAGQAVADFDALPEPDGLIHLAAIASPVVCDAHPELAHAVNVTGPQRLYQAILERWPKCPIVHVSTGHVYKPSPDPLREDQPLEPVNVYGRTKLAGEAMALELRALGHAITVVRPFNHAGAGQQPLFALPSFALRLAKIEQQGGGPLQVGWLGGVRDFLHARDVTAGYLDLLDRAGQIDLVNYCSGQGVVIGDLLDGLIERFDTDIALEQQDSRLRGDSEADQLVGDTTRLHALLGKVPSLNLAALLDELAMDARQRVATGENLDLA